MGLTDEQQIIIEETISNPQGVYGVSAAAGAGKSFTIFKMIDYIKEHEPNAKVLYLVFNKSNQVEAEQKLMKYCTWLYPVKVSTAHSYAYQKWLKVRGHFDAIERLDRDIIFKMQTESKIADTKYSKHSAFHWLYNEYSKSKLGYKNFCNSMIEHFEDDYDGPNKAKDLEVINKYGKKVEKYGIEVDGFSYISKDIIWTFEKIMKEHIDKCKYTHSMYLKAAAKSDKTGGDEYDYVFFDEAQDANYFMLKLLNKQKIKKLYFVGDSRQSIYKFGASQENVFETVKFNKCYTLSKSFRFGQDVADIANAILSLEGSFKQVVGTEQLHKANEDVTFLYRTNACLFKQALDLAYSAKQKSYPLKIDLMRTVIDITQFNELLYFLKVFYKNIDYSYYYNNKEILDVPMALSLKDFSVLVDKVGFKKAYNELYDYLPDDIHSIYNYASKEKSFVEKYNAYRNCLIEQNPRKTVTMCSMHRSKGLEWDNVVIAEPTKLYYEDKNGTIRRNSNYLQEENLAYVACTRARKTLNAEILRNELELEDKKFEDIELIVEDKTKELIA